MLSNSNFIKRILNTHTYIKKKEKKEMQPPYVPRW